MNSKNNPNSNIRDNYKRGSVASFLEEHITEGSKLSIVSAYFTIFAYEALKDKLNHIQELRFLFGEPSFLKNIDNKQPNQRDFNIEGEGLSLSQTLKQKSAAKNCAQWIEEKVQIKSAVKPNFLHGKMYHITQENGVEKAIMGSSNFTVSGLGLGKRPNRELNMIIDNDRDREDLKDWFDEMWNIDDGQLIEDVKSQVLGYLAKLYVENEPEFVYFKTLFHVFDKYLKDQEKGDLLREETGFFDTEIWNKLYAFQKDGVKGAINKILRYNGCIIADSVGLGKTFEALAVIRYFELLNYRVLVLCPKKLSENWTIYQASQNNQLNPFQKDRFNYTVLYHTDLGRKHGIAKANAIELSNFNWGAYDLVVIDESHNFKGNPSETEKEDGTSRMNRPKWLMEKVIKAGVNTKVLMLSATPVNNNLKDLRNQFYLITQGKDDALEEETQIQNIGITLKNAQTKFSKWSDPKTKDRSVGKLIQDLDSDFFKLLDTLSIARSRKHIKSFYQDVEKELGKFPQREKPKAIYSKIDLKDRSMSYDKINEMIIGYKLSLFNPSIYVKSEHQDKYDELSKSAGVVVFKQTDREHFLIGMMKINFLKRLESSVASFKTSMERTILKVEELQDKIKAFQKAGLTSQIEDLEQMQPENYDDNEADEENEAWQVGKKLKFDLADLKLEKWLEDLEEDKQALIPLLNFADAVTPERDAKLEDLKNLIRNKIKEAKNNGNKKVLVFTAFADTAQYLYENLQKWVCEELKLQIAMVAGSRTYTTFGTNKFSNILTNFAPKAKNRAALRIADAEKENEIDILIATDCISEGQNLQDCDTVINYDIHWNPVRVIQRFGRIDRLGSDNESIQLVNFWPTQDLDKYINLKQRVESRMALVDMTATNQDDILNEDSLKDLIEQDLNYRDKQLKALQEEVLDLDEMNDSIEFSQFTLDDFRIELLNFIESNREKLEEAPLGLYAVVPAPKGDYKEEFLRDKEFSETEKEVIKPGVVFCLRQKGDSKSNEKINPISPYFLVYIQENGTMRFNYTSAKQVLEIFRLLCSGQKHAFEKACKFFNDKTQEGKDMHKYSVLLKRAIKEIETIFNKKLKEGMTSDRGAVLPRKSERIQSDNFELITWLVIV
ncbi:MAG: NgoFVII family restriction endonuclease [Bernardetiaceae bacterium]|nr:NgoFVII family restriction endonuclease [Bernardetiaceae bacterium]